MKNVCDALGRELITVLDDASFLECPRWHDGALWVSDLYTGRVFRGDGTGPWEVVAHLDDRPAGLGFLPDGRALIVAMRSRQILVRADQGRLAVHADLSPLVEHQLNDMVVDRAGRAYVGNFGFDLMAGHDPQPTVLVRVDPDGTAAVVARDLLFPNGMAVVGDTLLVAESTGGRISAFDMDGAGALGDRRDWARFCPPPSAADLAGVIGQLSVVPDGICADAEGAIWVADALHARVLRVRAGGEIVDQIDTAPLLALACVLGGADGRTLFVCCAPSFLEHERAPVRESRLLATRVAVAGADPT